MNTLSDSDYIPVILQNAIFGLSLFAPVLLKKTRNRMAITRLFQQHRHKNRVAQKLAF
jgi:hypothetical protein